MFELPSGVKVQASATIELFQGEPIELYGSIEFMGGIFETWYELATSKNYDSNAQYTWKGGNEPAHYVYDANGDVVLGGGTVMGNIAATLFRSSVSAD